MVADSSRPITDWLLKVGAVAGAGLALGTLVGLVARRYASAILYVWRGYGVAKEDLPSVGDFTTVAGGIGGILMVVLWAVEPLL